MAGFLFLWIHTERFCSFDEIQCGTEGIQGFIVFSWWTLQCKLRKKIQQTPTDIFVVSKETDFVFC